MSQYGFSKNLDFFDEKCKCTLNNEEFCGAYNILVKYAQAGINKFNYKQLGGNVQPSDNGFIISVSGICQSISFQNTVQKEQHFSSTHQYS